MKKTQTDIRGSIETFPSPTVPRLDKAGLRHLLFQILLIRAFEERLLELKDSGLIHGPVHSSIGQEGAAVGAIRALTDGDIVGSTHRGHHHFLAKVLNARAGLFDPLPPGEARSGVPVAVPSEVSEVVRKTMAEIMGLADGYCRGRGGSMHLGDARSGCLGTNAIVGGGLGAVTGAAWSFALDGKDNVAVAFLGDGAVNQGIFHEVMNMAALWKAPAIYFIENNLYAVATHAAEACSVENLAQHGLAHGIDAYIVDGMDPLAVYECMTVARRRAVTERRPVLIEAKTYRYRHQAQGLPGSAFGYRTREEEERWLTRDPATTFPVVAEAAGSIDGAGAKALADAARDAVADASDRLTDKTQGTTIVPGALYPTREDLASGVRSEAGELGSLLYRRPGDFPRMVDRTYIDVVPEVMERVMEREPNVIVLGEEVGHMKGGAFMATKGLFRRFRDRVIDTPISEAGFSGMALGLALTGKKPVVEIMYPDFALVAADQLFNQIGKCRYMYGNQFDLPIVVRTRVAIGTGYGAQHSMEPAAFYALFPGWRIVAPVTPFDYIGLFNTAMACLDPVLVIEHQGLYPTTGPVPDDRDYCVPFGSARVVREGGDLTIVAYSRAVLTAAAACDRLATEGVEAELLDLRTVDYPSLDFDAIGRSVEKTGRLLVVEEGLPGGGIGAQVADEVQRRHFDWLDAEIRRVAAQPVPMPVSVALEAMVIPTPDDVAREARLALGLGACRT